MRLISQMRVLAAALMVSCAGCGTYIPSIQEPWEQSESLHLTAGGDLEFKIKEKVYCGIVEAVVEARKKRVLPKGWAVQVTLDLQVDETGTLNPGVSIIDPLRPSGVLTNSLGATLSSQGTREDKFGSYWLLDRLTGPTGNPCDPNAPPEQGSSLLLKNDLGLKNWLLDALAINFVTPSSTYDKNLDSAFKQDFLSYHVKFVVVSSGSVNPTLKLTRLSTGNGALPLLSGNRTRTHDLLVTFGPAFKAGSPNIAFNSHIIQEFGIASSNGNRTVLSPLINP